MCTFERCYTFEPRDWDEVNRVAKFLVGDRGPEMLCRQHMENYLGCLQNYADWEPGKWRTECLAHLLNEIREYRRIHHYYGCV